MKDDDDDNPDAFFSLKLASSFRRKASGDRINHIPINDSYFTAPSLLDEKEEFIHRIYFTGVSPWESEGTSPHLFFTIPFDPSLFDPVTHFCFPHGAKFQSDDIISSPQFINECLTKPTTDDLQFFTLYFPNIQDYPYFYCCKFMGNPFSMPTISNELDLEDIFSLCEKKQIPNTEMCICIQSNFPDQNLYYNFIKWLLECEKIGKYTIAHLFDTFYLNIQNKESTENIDFALYNESWPSKHRESLLALLGNVIFHSLPKIGESLIVDKPPFPKFEWKKEQIFATSNKRDLNLSLCCMKHFMSSFCCNNVNTYITLLSSLILEKKVVLYSKNVPLLTDAILVCHFMLQPLKWVNPSVSLLPDSVVDIFDSPSAILVGVDTVFDEIPFESVVFFDLDSKEIKIGKNKIIHFPKSMNLQEKLQIYFTKDTLNRVKTQKDEYIIEKEVLEITNMAIKELLNPLRASIITDFSDPANAGSRFLPELFLKNFPGESRVFVNHFLNTQMMQFHIELECKRCSREFDEQSKTVKQIRLQQRPASLPTMH